MPYRDDPGVPDLSQALGMAAGLFSSERDGASASSPPSGGQAAASTPLPSNEELAMRLATLFASAEADSNRTTASPSASTTGAASNTTSNDPVGQGQNFSLGNLASILPPLMQALSGRNDLVKPEKLNLVRAIKPYLSDGRSPGVDRAIRMANVAMAAKSALSLLGR